MDQLTTIKAFAEVASTGNFTRAADRMGLTRAAISKYVKQLEQRLGVKLVNRTTRRVALTEQGRLYHQSIQRILDDLATAEAAVTSYQIAPRGMLRVNAPMSFGMLHLSNALADFMDQFPELSVHLALNDRFIDLVEEGFDVAVRIGDLPDSSLIARRICPIRLMLCAAPSYLEERGAPATAEDLADHDCLIYGYMENSATWRLTDDAGKEHRVSVRSRFCANNGDVLATAAVAGHGIVLLPTFILSDHLRRGDLVRVLPGYGPQTLALNVVYPPSRQPAAKIRVFTDFLVARFGRLQPWDAGLEML